MPEGSDADLSEFFSLPIPAAIWSESKHLRDPQTARYVDALIAKTSARRHRGYSPRPSILRTRLGRQGTA
jgi:hypothetical protein